MHKRGALELSINAIVIIVLAMTLLGLGLGFVRGLFDNIIGVSGSTFERISEQLNTDLATSDAPLIFSKTRLSLDRGGSALEGFGVRNEKNAKVNYGIKLETFSCPNPAKEDPTKPETPCKPIQSWFTYVDGDNKYEVKPAERDVHDVQIDVPRSAITGLYLVQLIAYTGIWDGACIAADSTCFKLGQTELFLTVT
jgi:hypothetical protein